MENTSKLYNLFDLANHLKPDFKKSTFEKLDSWDFGWEILQTINVASSRDDDKLLSRRFAPGQKALYFFWYLDAQVTNGGFIQFYWNDYREYLAPIITGLKLIGDDSLLNLLNRVDKAYLDNKEQFDSQLSAQDWKPLYAELKQFDELDNEYYKIHNNSMALIEKYARKHPAEFVNLKRFMF